MENMNNFKVFVCLFVFIVLKIKISNCEPRQVKCSMYDNNKKCTISGLTLSRKNYTFFPVASDSSIVIKFELTASIVPVLTSNVCTRLPNLKNFYATGQHIEVIEDYAFNNCTGLLDLNLEKNNIYKLGKGIFSNTKQLQRLHILGASLQQIDVNLFSNLSELNQLVFSASGLKELPVEALINLKKLQYLYLYSNDLSDLDVDGLMENLPSLKTVYINDNNFHCDRLDEIIAAFKNKQILIHDHSFNIYLKKRDYIPRKVSNIICLTQAQLESEKMKKVLTNDLDGLKEYPIGKAVIQLKEIVTSGFTDADSNIVALSTTLNDTADNLNEQITNLNETFQNISTQISDTVNDLKENIENRNTQRQTFEAKLNATQHTIEAKLNASTARVQEIADTVAFLLDKYGTIMENLASTNKLNQNNNRANESLGYNLTAVWVLLTITVLIIVAISFFIYKRFRNIHVDVPIMCYENVSERSGHEQQENFT